MQVRHVGLFVHDTWRAIDCKLGSEVACNQPTAMDKYDTMFSLKTPLCDPQMIREIVKNSFEGGAELVTVCFHAPTPCTGAGPAQPVSHLHGSL